MPSNFILDVTESNFEYEVISYSQNKPVVVDFWAAWSAPCKVLSPLLEKLALESQGSFRLAKVDVDENPTLAVRFGVRSLPSVKAFSSGEVVSEFVGVQPETRLQEFVSKITPPSPLNLAIEKAQGTLAQHQYASAEKLFRQVLSESSENPVCVLGLVRTLLGQGKGPEALEMIRQFPPSRQYAQAEVLRPLAESLVALLEDRLPDETDLEITFYSSIRLVKRGNLPAAIDGLLDILRHDKKHNSGRTHQVLLGILDVLDSEDSESRQYRSELASILF